MDPSTPTAIPASLTTWLDPLTVALGLAVLAWLVSFLFQAWRRRSYNLTPMESAETGQTRPDFLKVDRQARATALARGDEYRRTREQPTDGTADPPPTPDQPPTQRNRLGHWLRVGAVALALANLLVISAGAVYRAQRTHELFYSLTSWERIQALIEQYWIGAGLAVLVIVVQLVKFLQLVFAGDQQGD